MEIKRYKCDSCGKKELEKKVYVEERCHCCGKVDYGLYKDKIDKKNIEKIK